ncbi:20270_t:CDS:2, partial [Entrophospora sp. SA101]
PPCPLPKTNKRFLFNIVRNVNNHNKAVIKRTEEKAAAALRRTIRIPSWSDDDKSYHKRKRREEGITIDTTAEVLRGGGEGVEAAIVEIEEKVMMIVEIGITIVIEEVLLQSLEYDDGDLGQFSIFTNEQLANSICDFTLLHSRYSVAAASKFSTNSGMSSSSAEPVAPPLPLPPTISPCAP